MENETKTLRDEFAMAALIGSKDDWLNNYKGMAKQAYEIADAMLEARKTGEKEND